MDKQLISGITNQLYAFTLDDDTDIAAINDVSARILQYIRANLPREVVHVDVMMYDRYVSSQN
jgi:hypothetical protein